MSKIAGSGSALKPMRIHNTVWRSTGLGHGPWTCLAVPEQGFDVTGVQLEGLGAIRYALFCLFLLGGNRGTVKEDLGVGALVVRVNIQRLAGKKQRH